MSKNKGQPNIDSLSGHSADHVLAFFKDRTREKLHLLKAKITQYQEKKLPKNQRRNISLDEIAKKYLQTVIKHQKYKAWYKGQNPQSQNELYDQQDTFGQSEYIEELFQQQKIYIENPVLQYAHKNDQGRKWKVNINSDIDFSCLKDSDINDLLSLLLMFENGYFPFLGKKDNKSKIFIQYLDKVKKRPSRWIETFKAPLNKDLWIVFSWLVQKLDQGNFAVCLQLMSIKKDLNVNKIDYEIDQRLKQRKYLILPGEVQISAYKDPQIKGEQAFRFGDKSFQFASFSAEKMRRLFPCRIEQRKLDFKLQMEEDALQQHFAAEIQIVGDNSNYDSVRYIYRELANSQHFSYELSPSEYEVLEAKGNLIVIGRSGTGKTTCALLRLFFKEINNSKKLQRNVFLTASSTLISEINKKYNLLKDGIRELHDYDYFERRECFNEGLLVERFFLRLEQINEARIKRKINSFLEQRQFPCFLTIREYIESVDAMMANPFFTTVDEKNKEKVEGQFVTQYPDEIEWELRAIKTRITKRKQNQQIDQAQQWKQIDYNHFAKHIFHLPEIRRLSGLLSPEIVWSEIYSTIKGSSRAHSFCYKCLDFQTYSKESKNKFLNEEQKKIIYEIFIAYEKIKQKTNQYDLIDVVNNVILQLGRRENNDLALSSLFIDEVQDMPPAFIFLAGKIVQESLFFCGDTAQTIAKGLSFSFSDVREQFSQKYYEKNFKLQKPNIMQLGVNFRSHNQIIQLSNSLIRCLELMFPESIDRMPFETSPNKGSKPIVVGKDNSWRVAQMFRQRFDNFLHNNDNILFGADKAIIVRNKEAKSKLPEEFSSMTCLTYQQCKGLQYNVVILYDFFSSQHGVQWSFLKHINLETHPNGTKTLGFDKNRLGSNKRLYFDLCSQLKILYTVVTRPKKVLIICDDNFPQQLMKIWRFLDLVQETLPTLAQLRSFDQKNRQSNQKSDGNGPGSTLNGNEDRKIEQKMRQKQQVKIDECEQNFEKFREMWAEQGFKLFFDHKLYDEAAKCFKNIEVRDLAEISKAFSLAQYASDNPESSQQNSLRYKEAGAIFERYERYYEAGKCYYLGGCYEKGLGIFRKLQIRKYEAQCLWRLRRYSQAERLFYLQEKYVKSFQVLVESQNWYLLFVRLNENVYKLGKNNEEMVSAGLRVVMGSLIGVFAEWMIREGYFEERESFFNRLIFKIVNKEGTVQKEKKKISWFSQIYELYSQTQATFDRNKWEIDKRQIHDDFIDRLEKIQYTNVLIEGLSYEILTTFLTTLLYMNSLLDRYRLVGRFRKYTQKSFGLRSDKRLQDRFQSYVSSLQGVFSILETFKAYEFALVLAKVMGFVEIQEQIIMENILRVDGRKADQQEVLNAMNLHYKFIGHISSSAISSKLSVFLLLFGTRKNLGHLFEDDEKTFNDYLGVFAKDSLKDVVTLRPQRIKNEYRIVGFDFALPYRKRQREIYQTHQYQTMFELIDDLSPGPYFLKNQKEKEYVDNYKILTKQQQECLKERQKLALQQNLQLINRRIERAKKSLEIAEEQKNEKILKIIKRQTDAFNKKQQIMKSILKYVWTPEQCEKTPQRVYNVKKQPYQIRNQRNIMLSDIDAQINELIDEERNNVGNMKDINYLKESLETLQTHLKDFQRKRTQFQLLAQKKKEIQSSIVKKNKQLQELKISEKEMNIGGQETKIIRIKEIKKNLGQLRSELDRNNHNSKKAKQFIDKNKKEYLETSQQIEKTKQRIERMKGVLCELGVAMIDEKCSLLIMTELNEGVVEYNINRYKKDRQRAIRNKQQARKESIKKQYGLILKNVDDYSYYHETVPLNYRMEKEAILKEIQKINQQIQKLEQQRENQRLKTETRVKKTYLSKVFKENCWKARERFVRLDILYNQFLQEQLDTELVDVLRLIQRVSNIGVKATNQQQNRNSCLLQNIIQAGDYSHSMIFMCLHFLIHEQQMQLLQTIVVKNIYEKFCCELQRFVETVKYEQEEGRFLKSVLAVMGVNLLETFDGDEMKYLEGFSLIERNHNFVSLIKTSFFFEIPYSHILCRTSDILVILKNFLINKAKKSSVFSRFMSIEHFAEEQKEEFDMRNEEFLHSMEKKLITQIRNGENFDAEVKYIRTSEIHQLKRLLFDLKKIYFSYIILCEQNPNVTLQIKAEKIVGYLDKVNILTQFVYSLKSVIEFNKESILKSHGNESFVDEMSEQMAEQLKRCTIPKVNKVMNLLQGIKQKQEAPVYKQTEIQPQSPRPSSQLEIQQFDSQLQEQFKGPNNRTLMVRGSVSQKIGSKLRREERRVINSKPTAIKRYIKPYEQNISEDQQYEHDVKSSYENRSYFDMMTGKWAVLE